MSRTVNISKKIVGVVSLVVLIIIVIALVKGFGSDPALIPDLKPADSTVNNAFLSEYAGEYTVKVDGYSDTEKESYVLRKNGTAAWMLIIADDSQGARTASEKYGTWTATEGNIVISIQGNTGTITEEFNYQNDRFLSILTAGRYLKPTE